MFASRSLSRGARPSRLILAALFFAGAVSLASAQTVTLRGNVEDVPGGFILSCTPVHLVSGGANLPAVLGQEVVATGTIIAPNLVSVATVAVVTDVLEVNKNASVGGQMKFDVTGPVGQAVQIHFALANGFAPIKAMGWFLDPVGMHFLLQGVIPATGKLEVTLNVPNIPALANLDVYFQVVRLPAGGGFQLGNADCVTIAP